MPSQRAASTSSTIPFASSAFKAKVVRPLSTLSIASRRDPGWVGQPCTLLISPKDLRDFVIAVTSATQSTRRVPHPRFVRVGLGFSSLATLPTNFRFSASQIHSPQNAARLCYCPAGGCHSSTLFPSGSMTQANFPYSDSSIFSSTLQPSSRKALTSAWRSSTR